MEQTQKKKQTGHTVEDRINTVYGGGGQVVILGAGASIASSLRNPELSGKKLPSMNNFVEVIGLQDVVEDIPEKLRAVNFETLYSNLYNDNPKSSQILEIQRRVHKYFSEMHLPDEATIYDYMVLALRPKDLIASFNWDPFLFEAWSRNHKIAEPTNIAFLHGTVAFGYSTKDKSTGLIGATSPKGDKYLPIDLLYPVHKKNYNANDYLVNEWGMVKAWLKDERTKLVTVFGYSAPETDIEAIKLLNESYGPPDRRDMEQFEIIDVRGEDFVVPRWDGFIHSHHYDYRKDYFESSLARNPRRTSESYFQHIMPMTPDEAFSASNPVPSSIMSLKELWKWHEPLIKAEEKWHKELK